MTLTHVILIASFLFIAAMAPFVIFLRGKRTVKQFKIAVAVNVTIFFGSMLFLLIYILTRGAA